MKIMSLLNRNDAFTIIWKIHNFSMCTEVKVSAGPLYSATLTVDMLGNTKWYLSLLSKDINGDKCLLCQLFRHDDLNSTLNISISYSIELISIDSSELNSKISHGVFKKDDYAELSLGKLNEIYNKKDILLPSDILTVQCCIWRSDKCNSPEVITEKKVDVECLNSNVNKETTSQDKHIHEQKTLINHVYAQNVDKLDPILAGEMYSSAEERLNGFTKNLLPNKCVVRTGIELERRSILWAVDKFSEMKIGQTIFMPVLSTKLDTPLILGLYLFGEDEGECVLRINIQRDNVSDPILVKCSITIVNVEREDLDCIQDVRLLNCDDKWHLTLANKNKLLGKDRYLKNDILFLRCEFTISAYDRDWTAEVITSYPENRTFPDVSDSDTWKKKSLRVFEKSDFCDITLQIGEHSICAHKVVLCASSTYFRKMFSDDFKQQTIEITNCESGTLEKLLKYLYLGVLEEMPHEDLIKLYSAAIKFQVAGLKRLCSLKLKASLEVSNVCDVLTIANLHNDQFLKTAVGKFISEYANEVFHSSKWKNFMDGHPILTGNVMYEVLTNKYSL